MAKHDKAKFADIITATESEDRPYYTNSSHLPVGYTEDIFEALDVQDELQTLYTSGTVFHAFLGEKLPDWKAAAALVRKISEQYKLPYYTISPTYSVCKNHGYLSGEQYVCPHCNEATEVYSRITGYYRPVQNWNAGKSQEFCERKTYDMGRVIVSGKEALHTDKKELDTDSQVRLNKMGKHLLFTTKTCPNCKLAYRMLDQAGIVYEVIDAQEHEDLVKQYGVMQAPTLVVDDGEQSLVYTNASDIQRYLHQQHS